jgi:hypothetical protein
MRWRQIDPVACFSGAGRGFLYAQQPSGSRCPICYRAGEGLEGRGEVREPPELSDVRALRGRVNLRSVAKEKERAAKQL